MKFYKLIAQNCSYMGVSLQVHIAAVLKIFGAKVRYHKADSVAHELDYGVV